MLPLQAWTDEARRNIVGVFTDIDDTLTTDGAITPDALAALGQLKAAGFHVIAITGRPVGWSVPFAQSWPLDAIVAENGAVALVRQDAAASGCDGSDGLRRLYLQDASTRATQYQHMQEVAAQILREVPGSTLAQDSAGRETDIAIDHSEFSHLSAQQIARVVAIMQANAMSATVSSIHINGWFGAHDKLAGARWIVRELFGRALDRERERWATVGDSTNDQAMFAAFEHSIAVANVRRFLPQLTHLPRYVTPGERGAGFAQVAAALLDMDRG